MSNVTALSNLETSDFPVAKVRLVEVRIRRC
jgi:hypothetical protein